MLFKNSVRTSKRTPHFAITKINWLTLFKFKGPLFQYYTCQTKKQADGRLQGRFTIEFITATHLFPILSEVCPTHNAPSCFHFTILILSSEWRVPFSLSNKNLVLFHAGQSLKVNISLCNLIHFHYTSSILPSYTSTFVAVSRRNLTCETYSSLMMEAVRTSETSVTYSSLMMEAVRTSETSVTYSSLMMGGSTHL
jgi:hypothetical protein